MKSLIYIILLSCISITFFSQNVNVSTTMRVIETSHSEYGSSGGDCWEWGTEEYTGKVWFWTDADGTWRGGTCRQCSNNGNCGNNSTTDTYTYASTAAYTVDARMQGWEDDNGSRCDYDGGDDCYTSTYLSGWGPNRNFRETAYPSNGTYYTYGGSANQLGDDDNWGAIQVTWKYTGTASSITPSCVAQSTTHSTGRIRSNSVYLTSGVPYRFETTSGPDTYLRLYSSDGYTIVASNDDGGTGTLSLLTYTPGTTGWYYIENSQYTRGALTSASVMEYYIDVANTPGSIAGITDGVTICSNTDPGAFTNSASATGFGSLTYQWQVSTTSSVAGFSNIGGANSTTYNPGNLTQQSWFRRRVTDGCGRITYSNVIQINISTLSTIPSIAPVAGKICPNTTTTITASGGTAGAGSVIRWYSGALGTGSLLGTGGSLNVSPTVTTTYYARREGTCNTTADVSVVLNVKEFVYTPVGSVSSIGYCTDDSGWNHFYDGLDQIIFSVQGDFSSVTTAQASIANNATFYQATNTSVWGCSTEETFEMKRSWNLDYTGSLAGFYSVRYYFPAAEKTAIETAVIAYMAANPSCAYAYKYPNPIGFFWFKNTGSSYSAPDYDGLHLTGSGGSINGVNYSEITGVTSFSGGSGGITLISNSVALPVELTNFSGWNNGNSNNLDWTTMSEINNEKFEVERMLDGENDFKLIGEVSGNGNSTAQVNYIYLDKDYKGNFSMYRLKQIDFNGDFEYSDVIRIDHKNDDFAYIYPTAAEEELTVFINAVNSKSAYIHIYDINGKLIRNSKHSIGKGASKISLNVNDLAKGSYLIHISDQQNNIILNDKFIKM